MRNARSVFFATLVVIVFIAGCSDDYEHDGSFQWGITSSGGGSIAIGNTSLPDAQLGVSYSHTFSASGGTGNYSWYLDNAPSWLSIATSTGMLSGTPGSGDEGTTSFGVEVWDDGSPQSYGTVQVTINVTNTTVSLGGTPPPPAFAGEYYQHQFPAIGGTGPFQWTITSGSVPTGTTLDTNTGIVSGNPTATGAYNFDLQITDTSTNNTDSQNITLDVWNKMVHIGDTKMAVAVEGAAYSHTFLALTGTPTYVWNIYGAPSWLTLNSSTGEVTGTPPAGAADDSPYHFMVFCEDTTPNDAGMAQVTLTVSMASPGASWYQETATPGWSARQWPNALVFDNKIWVIAGRNNSGYVSDLWYSSSGSSWTGHAEVLSTRDGVGWNTVTQKSALGARGAHGAVKFKGRIYVLGGQVRYPDDSYAFKNDVWWTE